MKNRTRLRILLSTSFWIYLLESFIGFIKRLGVKFVENGDLPSNLRAVRFRKDLRISRSPNIRLGEGVLFGHRVILHAERELGASQLVIEDQVRFADDVNIGAELGESLRIGYQTSINRGATILGNVDVGAYNSIATNAYVAAGSHYTQLRPSWLIWDQDRLAATEGLVGREKTILDDDVWIGWGAFVCSGVRIGKGAVIAANSYVTKNILPYTICGGNPARPFSKRLDFVPPSRLDPLEDASLPYFYSGFFLEQSELQNSRKLGLIYSRGRSTIVLGARAGDKIVLSGRGELLKPLQISANGLAVGSISPGENRSFEYEFTMPQISPHPFFENAVEIAIQSSLPPRGFGLGRVEVLSKNANS